MTLKIEECFKRYIRGGWRTRQRPHTQNSCQIVAFKFTTCTATATAGHSKPQKAPLTILKVTVKAPATAASGGFSYCSHLCLPPNRSTSLYIPLNHYPIIQSIVYMSLGSKPKGHGEEAGHASFTDTCHLNFYRGKSTLSFQGLLGREFPIHRTMVCIMDGFNKQKER